VEKLHKEIKELIVKALELEDVTAEEIDDDEALFGDGLGLDSIDALELGVALQKNFDVKIQTKKEDLTIHFANVKSLAAFIGGLQMAEKTT